MVRCGPGWVEMGGMFTGLVEETGTVEALRRSAGASRLIVRAGRLAAECRVGESVAVNGCCLTVATAPGDGTLEFDLLEETLRRTNLGNEPALVNLERALAANGRLGGHFVQGHVDCTAAVRGWERAGEDYRLDIELPRDFAKYVVEKGSISVDGISLTVAEVGEESFAVWIIPHTREQTNLREVQAGGRVESRVRSAGEICRADLRAMRGFIRIRQRTNPSSGGDWRHARIATLRRGGQADFIGGERRGCCRVRARGFWRD